MLYCTYTILLAFHHTGILAYRHITTIYPHTRTRCVLLLFSLRVLVLMVCCVGTHSTVLQSPALWADTSSTQSSLYYQQFWSRWLACTTCGSVCKHRWPFLEHTLFCQTPDDFTLFSPRNNNNDNDNTHQN